MFGVRSEIVSFVVRCRRHAILLHPSKLGFVFDRVNLFWERTRSSESEKVHVPTTALDSYILPKPIDQLTMSSSWRLDLRRLVLIVVTVSFCGGIASLFTLVSYGGPSVSAEYWRLHVPARVEDDTPFLHALNGSSVKHVGSESNATPITRLSLTSDVIGHVNSSYGTPPDDRGSPSRVYLYHAVA